ncbi:MAG TPA: tetratricopeptide repeat protein [Gammaproteobacteria bacterium]|nr:tetratricopeptide repeat protein [Gammaproteobacteria bacterium]
MDWHAYMTTAQNDLSMPLKTSLCILLLLVIAACSTPQPPRTLGDIDITDNHRHRVITSSAARSNEEIREAYARYLSHSGKSNGSRTTAINRLAELEFELGSKTAHEKDLLNSTDEDRIDIAYIDRLNKMIELITYSLAEYPNAQGNDKLLYNLANAYEQKGELAKSVAALDIIVNKYPGSKYYLESQFRVAENYYSKKEYISAEDAYTNVIYSKRKNKFIEKSLLKRGWARFKLGYHQEAIDDFLHAVTYHNFDKPDKLTSIEKDIFDEYFRAIGLSFSYMGDLNKVYQYLENQTAHEYIYHVYKSISDIYFKQNRYSDSAVTLIYFTKKYPDSRHIPKSRVKVIKIWRQAGFFTKYYAAIDSFYSEYNPESQYWTNQNADLKTQREIDHSLKEYTLLMAKHFHSEYQARQKEPDFSNAKKWYQRFLTHYPQHSRKDNIHFLYAELLSEHGSDEEALHYYEIAAYDAGIILDRDSAYSTIYITSRLYRSEQQADKKSEWLDRHIKYATLYGQLYPNDKQSPGIVTHAAELAFNARMYSKAIELTSLVSGKADSRIIENVRIIRGQSYMALKQYVNAEDIYQSLLHSANTAYITQYQIADKLAFSIYQQGVAEKNSGNIMHAIRHFRRIPQIVPESSIAPAGMDEAVTLSINNEMWEEAIILIKEYQARYPHHDLNQDMSKKLSLAYLRSGQDIAAAQEYEKISKSGKDLEIKIAALWKAAELYESNNEILLAINAYSEFADTYPNLYSQHMEVMYRLAALYDSINTPDSANLWRHRILIADKDIISEKKTERTNFITSSSALVLANNEYKAYKKLKLLLPLKESLKKKKLSLQKAVRLFGQASVYGVAETTTEATHGIAEIYNIFSQTLLHSERPLGLNNDELEEYEILLEDQAFPFEEKAIEFFEVNLSYIKDGFYDSWIQKSHHQLMILFPAKYQRQAKTDTYINVLH